ncbi:hypothetical protein ACA910_019632 [Epithemia clementina (nom. ined.)]
MTPYLKGIHLTLESWRSDRDHEGWKLTPGELALLRMGREEPGSAEEHSGEKAPATVKPVSRFAEDVAALKSLTSGEKPPRVLARPKESAVTAMMFGDASGAGFGTSLWIQEAANIHATRNTESGRAPTAKGPSIFVNCTIW